MPTKALDLQKILFSVSLVICILVIFIGYTVFLAYIRKKRNLIKIEEQRREFSKALLKSKFEIQEQTLRHLSSELHDNIGQIASLVKMNLSAMKFAYPTISVDRIDETTDLARQLLSDIKSLSVSLGSDIIERAGFSKAIALETERTAKAAGCQFHFEIFGTLPLLPFEHSVILYRMIQECLGNILKHSQANNINVIINASVSVMSIIIQDGGIGFIVKERGKAGSGLTNLHQRISQINGILNITSNPGNGTVTEITIFH